MPELETKDRTDQAPFPLERPPRDPFLEVLFEGISEEIMVMEPDGTIRDVNRVFLLSRGLRREDVLARKCYEVQPLGGYPCAFGTPRCPLERAKRTGDRVEMTFTSGPEWGEMREQIRIMYPVGAGTEGPRHFVEISRDVTGYRDLIRKLRASERKFKAILDTATDAIISINQDHQIVLFNKAAEKIFGYKREEVINTDVSLLIPPQYGDHYHHVRRFLESRTPRAMGRSLSLTAFRKGGEEFPIELGLSHQEKDGELIFTAIIRDVSEQKQLEKRLLQSQRLAAVGETVAHVAHEIKNPLMIIGGFSHQIRPALNDPKAVQKVDMILDEVERLERLVASLGDFTRVYSLVKRPADIHAVIWDVLNIVQGIRRSQEYHFDIHLDEDVGEIECDPDKIKQVLINLIVNAMDAMEKGGTVSIITRHQGASLQITVEDHGTGIQETELFRIFEPFFTTRSRGSGLGLAISYKVIEAHQGEIWAESEIGRGTTMHIKLPTRMSGPKDIARPAGF